MNYSEKKKTPQKKKTTAPAAPRLRRRLRPRLRLRRRPDRVERHQMDSNRRQRKQPLRSHLSHRHPFPLRQVLVQLLYLRLHLVQQRRDRPLALVHGLRLRASLHLMMTR